MPIQQRIALANAHSIGGNTRQSCPIVDRQQRQRDNAAVRTISLI
jgi:hypothetical protein